MIPFDSRLVLPSLTYLAGTISEWRVHIKLLNRRIIAPLEMTHEGKAQFLKSIERLTTAATELEMGASSRISKDAFDVSLALLGNYSRLDVHALEQLVSQGDRVVYAFVADMAGLTALVVPRSALTLFQSPQARFGDAVASAFSSVDLDLREAGKCLALERYTACVFHCMRIMEAGIASLAVALGLNPATNWNKALEQIEKEIRGRNAATHGSAWRVEEGFYAEAVTHFRVVKNAWRNHTMHGRETFDSERAKAVFESTAAFMRHLASRLDEASAGA